MAGKILIIEDSEQDQKILERVFKKAGYQNLVFASSGEEGIEKATAETPDLIVLDLGLPRKSGPEVHNELKQHPRTRNIPVLFNTGLMKPGESAGAGVNQSIVAKTPDAGDLLSKVREIMGGDGVK